MLDIVLVNHHTSFQVLADYSSIYWTSNVPSISLELYDLSTRRCFTTSFPLAGCSSVSDLAWEAETVVISSLLAGPLRPGSNTCRVNGGYIAHLLSSKHL